MTENNKAQMKKHGYYYVYEIHSTAGDVEPLEVDLKFPIDGNLLVVKSLPPGSYAVESVSIIPQGVGTSGSKTHDVHFPFMLEDGRITIFTRSLDVTRWNAPGRGADITTNYGMSLVSENRRKAVIAELAKLEYFNEWSIRP